MLRTKETANREESKAEKPQYNGVRVKTGPPNGVFAYE
jgi:hypothetical protein